MLRTVRARLGALALIALGAVALSGCIDVKVSATYNADDTVDFSGSSIYDAEYVSEMGLAPEDLAAQAAEAFAEQVTSTGVPSDSLEVDPYVGDDGSAGMSYTVTGATPEQFFGIMATNTEGDGSSMSYTHADGTITVTSGSESEAAESDSSGITIDPAEAGITAEQRFTFPGPVQSTTVGSVDPSDPTTVVIDDPLQLMSGAPWTIVASDDPNAEAPESVGGQASAGSDSDDASADAAASSSASPSASPSGDATAAAVTTAVEASPQQSTLGLKLLFGGLVVLLAATIGFGIIMGLRSR